MFLFSHIITVWMGHSEVNFPHWLFLDGKRQTISYASSSSQHGTLRLARLIVTLRFRETINYWPVRLSHEPPPLGTGKQWKTKQTNAAQCVKWTIKQFGTVSSSSPHPSFPALFQQTFDGRLDPLCVAQIFNGWWQQLEVTILEHKVCLTKICAINKTKSHDDGDDVQLYLGLLEERQTHFFGLVRHSRK